MQYRENPPIETLMLYESTRDDSPVETVTTEGGTASRIVYCDWADVDDALEQILGKVTISGAAPYTLTLTMPQPFSVAKRAYFLADEVAVEGRGYQAPTAARPEVAQHNRARMRIVYKPYPRKSAGSHEADGRQVLFHEEMRPAVEFRTLPGRKLYWDNLQAERVGEDESPALLEHSGEWVCTLRRLPSLPIGLLNYAGRLNSEVVTSLRYSIAFQKHTLLMQMPVARWSIDARGIIQWSVEYTMLLRKCQWDYFYRAGATAAAQIYDSAGDPWSPYGEADLNDVLLLA